MTAGPADQGKQINPAAVGPLAAAPASRRGAPAQGMPGAVIPLLHAPDDPGPEAVDEVEPQAEPPSGGWRKILE